MINVKLGNEYEKADVMFMSRARDKVKKWIRTYNLPHTGRMQ